MKIVMCNPSLITFYFKDGTLETVTAFTWEQALKQMKHEDVVGQYHSFSYGEPSFTFDQDKQDWVPIS